MKTPIFIKILGSFFLTALLIFCVPAAMADDQDQTHNRDQGEIPDHDQNPDQSRIRGNFEGKLLDGDRLRTRDRLKDGSCQLEGLSSAQNTNMHEWRYQYRYLLNGSVPPGSQGFALLPLWLVRF